MFCHGVTRFLHHYPYVTSVCLTLTQIHLPQSLPLHRINGFARFFHGFISVLLLHSGHTSKPQIFHCFSIVSRALRDNGPISEPQFFHCFSILLLLFYLAALSKRSTEIFHCFPIVLCDILIFSIPQVSIPHRHPIATWYITLKKFTCIRLFYHLIS